MNQTLEIAIYVLYLYLLRYRTVHACHIFLWRHGLGNMPAHRRRSRSRPLLSNEYTIIFKEFQTDDYSETIYVLC